VGEMNQGPDVTDGRGKMEDKKRLHKKAVGPVWNRDLVKIGEAEKLSTWRSILRENR